MTTKQKVILIGGAQGAGKTTLAQALSQRLQIPWISTDQIRTICDVESRGKENLEVEIAHNEEIWKGVERFVRCPFPWEQFIIEGVAILPHLVASLDIPVSPIFIIDTDEASVAETVFQRSLLPWINTKTEDQQKARVQYILAFNTFIRDEAQKYGFPLIKVSKSDADVEKIIELLSNINT